MMKNMTKADPSKKPLKHKLKFFSKFKKNQHQKKRDLVKENQLQQLLPVAVEVEVEHLVEEVVAAEAKESSKMMMRMMMKAVMAARRKKKKKVLRSKK